MDTLTSMRVFARVVELGSFSGAAARLDMANSMVTKHVSELEARLGVRLLHRTTRRLSLTEQGAAYLEGATALLAELDTLENGLRAETQAPTGLLRLNAPVTFGVTHLGPMLADYCTRYPKVQVDLQLTDRNIDLVEEGCDLAIRVSRRLEGNFVGRHLATSRLVACASPAYLKAHGTPTHPRDLAEHRCVAFTYSDTSDEWRFTGPEGEVGVRVKPDIRANNGYVLRALAVAGRGIVVQPSFIVGDHLRSGELVEVLPAYAPPELGMYAIYPHRKYLSAKVRTMIDFLSEALPPRVA